MKLSELKTGEKGVIVKVAGHGGFRKRIVEMGFIKGKMVEVLQNAPLQDPVKYKILGYEVSLRRSEADHIEVMTPDEVDMPLPTATLAHTASMAPIAPASHVTDQQLADAALRRRKVINVALVGNPNCGKTSLFNFASGAHERVGNYSGVTVDAKEGEAHFEGYTLRLTDLPGTYSLSAYSPEELYVRRQLIDQTPDVVINIIDTSNLERNLYLTTQLIDMHIRMVCALNMYDEAEKRGDHIDCDTLSRLFGAPMVPTVFADGRGVDELFRAVITMYEGTEGDDPHYRHLHINHGHEIEHGIHEIQDHLKQAENLRHRYSTRYLAIKLLERDADAENYIRTLPDATEILRHRDEAAARVKEETGDDSETAIMDAKYGFINGALQEARYTTGHNTDTYRTTHLIDSIITHRYAGFPIFILVLATMFAATFLLGRYPMDWIGQLVAWTGELAGEHLPAGPLKDMVTDGIIGGVGAVIVFLPQILILYFFISFMEDSGYMARAAFIMDKLMHKIGLHGKSFIPLIMGFGCNVPAVIATRTIESRRSRLITMLILPFMSCSARLPIYVMITAIFFAPRQQPLVMLSLYLIGIAIAALVSRILSRHVIKGEDTPFVMELPPYRFPTTKAIARHTWEKGKEYLRKMGGIILVASITVWALGYFPHHEDLSPSQQQEQSLIGHAGKAIEPLFRAQGFNWKLDMGIVAGVGAKEIVASTVGVLYADDNTHNQSTTLRARMQADGITPLIAYSYLVFILIYFPCIATLAAIRAETGSWRWTIVVALYTTTLAWIVSAIVYQIGKLF
ncbi:MAG: ferrous iron transport protein B [Prevotella sp.]|nr:ferrous iron transport protein B [Bacteroidales bacterium]MDY3843378.1 ferrous iron transport protein B [Prevotella sp.]